MCIGFMYMMFVIDTYLCFNGICLNFYAHKNHMIPEIVFISVADT